MGNFSDSDKIVWYRILFMLFVIIAGSGLIGFFIGQYLC